MRLRFPLYLGLKNLLGRNGTLSSHMRGSIIGIALSLIPLILVLEVADGMIEGITSRYLELGTYHLQIKLPIDSSIERYRTIAEELMDIDTVRQIIIERQGMGLLYSPKARTGVTVRAVPPTLYREDESFRELFSLESGSFDLGASNAILLGREIAEKLGVGVGDQVKLLTTLDTAAVSDKRYIPKVSLFDVKGIFSTGYQELDKLWTYIPLKTGVRILSLRNSSQFIGVKLKDPFHALNEQMNPLIELLPGEARIYTWYQLEKANYKSFQTTKALLLFIMALIVVVAAVNIASAMMMVVLEKNQEIGILKGMGAHPQDISLAFLVTGFIAGTVGIFIGMVMGLLIAVNINGLISGLDYFINLIFNGFRALILPFFKVEKSLPIKIFNTAYYLEEIPIRIKVKELSFVAAATLLLTTMAAYLPARGAGRIKPLEILRKY